MAVEKKEKKLVRKCLGSCDLGVSRAGFQFGADLLGRGRTDPTMCVTWPCETSVQRPRSISFTEPEVVNMTFEDLRSR